MFSLLSNYFRDKWRRIRRANRLGERLYTLWRVAVLLFSPSYERARQAVRSTAIEPDIRDKHVSGLFWARHMPLSRENLTRHMLATERFGVAPLGARHYRNLLLELAYFALKERGR